MSNSIGRFAVITMMLTSFDQATIYDHKNGLKQKNCKTAETNSDKAA
jgi:hypothetical protein